MQLVQLNEARFKVAMTRATLAEMCNKNTSFFPDYASVAAYVLPNHITWAQYKAISALCNSKIPADIKLGNRGFLPAAQTLHNWYAAPVHALVCT
jgi:hypothetical protein